MALPVALVLWGGRARRMQAMLPSETQPADRSIDKGLLACGKQRLIDHVIERIRPQCSALWLNRSTPVAGLPYPLVPDAPQWAGQGPLAGLHAGLTALVQQATKDQAWLLTVPCDAPCLPPDLVTTLGGGLDGAHGCVARTSEGLQPVVGLWSTVLLTALERFLATGGRSMHDWVAECHAGSMCFEARHFINMNQPSDLAAWGTP